MFSCNVNTFLLFFHYNQHYVDCHVHVLHHILRERYITMPGQGKQTNSIAKSLISDTSKNFKSHQNKSMDPSGIGY